jgi:hypothetical protein
MVVTYNLKPTTLLAMQEEAVKLFTRHHHRLSISELPK